jgi:hypothetical protein
MKRERTNFRSLTPGSLPLNVAPCLMLNNSSGRGGSNACHVLLPAA